MTLLLRKRDIANPQDIGTKLDALRDAVESIRETFSVQFGIDLALDGMPGTPDPGGVIFGGTVALTSEKINFQYACAFPEETARDLTRILFALEDDANVPMEDLGDAMNEIPNVAAGVWKAKREPKGENYQLGLPLFIRGSGWIQYFPRGVNAVSQPMTTPDGRKLQVVLSWQNGTDAGGIFPMSNAIENAVAGSGHYVPAEVLQEAVNAVVETCRIQMDLELQVDANPSDPRQAEVDYGSSIALTSETGSWQLAVMCNKLGSKGLTRSLFAMEPDEDPAMEDMADALGEIANVAAGVMKSSRAAAGQKIQLGLPLFMEGRSCIEFFASGIQGMAQTVRGPDDLEAHVILIWQEG
ncbi:MAG: chemotaxis protein CheX [bacterium]